VKGGLPSNFSNDQRDQGGERCESTSILSEKGRLPWERGCEKLGTTPGDRELFLTRQQSAPREWFPGTGRLGKNSYLPRISQKCWEPSSGASIGWENCQFLIRTTRSEFTESGRGCGNQRSRTVCRKFRTRQRGKSSSP